MALTTLLLPDLQATEAVAKRLAAVLRPHDIIALQGPLGAGKTSFARALLASLGVSGEVPSPTFTLVQFYETPAFPIYHFDLYRLENETDIVELGWDDALADGLILVEWPERAPASMPVDRLTLRFTVEDKGRRLAFEPSGSWAGRLEALK